MFSGVDDPLREIAGLGLKTVEFSLKPGFKEEDMRFLLDRCLKAGLGINLHPYTNDEHNPACFEDKEGNVARETGRRFLEIAHMAGRVQGKKTVLILHGASTVDIEDCSGTGEDKSFFLERSRCFFRWLEKYVLEKELEILIVSELQITPSPEEHFFRVGDSYTEVLETVKGTDLGLCWDTGHAYFAHLRKGISLIPPEDFIKKVRHVHLHDVRAGEDHQPLSAGTIPLPEYLKLLGKFNFSGDITLEFSPYAVASYGSFKEVLQDSMRRVAEALLC